MRRVQTKQTLKLHLLALVLALALLWYSLNPALGTVIYKKQEPELPDEKKRNAEPQRTPIALGPLGMVTEPLLLGTGEDDEDEFEWPEFIDG